MSLKIPEISPKQLNALFLEGQEIVLIDVREPFEAAFCSLPHSVLIPLGEFAGRVDEIPSDRDVVVYCRSGGRSEDAVRYLIERGFSNVHNLAGGILRWSDEVDSRVPKY